MSQPLERLRLFVPCERLTPPPAPESEWVANPRDDSFVQAFSHGHVEPAFREELRSAAGAWVIPCPFDLATGRAQACALVTAISGAVGVRVEQSKVGWRRDHWLTRLGSEVASDWHRAVVVVLTGSDQVQSCGMHAFSLPDVLVGSDGDARAAVQLATTFNVYQLAERPLLVSGQTFQPDAESPRRVLRRWPDVGYPPSSPCNNPYGVWRLDAPGGNAEEVSGLALTFMPSLIAMLSAAESKAGRPLTRDEVLAIRDGGVCITMKWQDVRTLELTRGYADLDPGLAWEQWVAYRSAEAPRG